MIETASITEDTRFFPLQVELKRILASGIVRRTVLKILENEVDFQECRSSASIHENCFVKVPIEVGLPHELRLRIHFWFSSSNEQNVHDHRFDFSSAVVAGAIENIIWVDDKIGNTFSGFRYHNDQSGRRLVLQSDRKLTVRRQESCRTGDSYTVNRDTLHTIKHSGDAITIILENRTDLKPYANVYSPVNRSVGDTPPMRVSDYMLRERLLEFCLRDADIN